MTNDTPGEWGHGWRKKLAESAYGDATFTWGLDLLQQAFSNIDNNAVSRCLIHGDLINRNVLVADDKISGLFDWVGNGKQTWLNGDLIQVKPCQRIEDAILLTTEHWSVFEHQNGPAFETLSKQVKRYNTWGDCHGYYLVTTGGADIMTDPILNEWDLMALIPIIEGAGGVITDWQGNDVIGGSGAVATAGSLHDEVGYDSTNYCIF